jgi:hypothetical protein
MWSPPDRIGAHAARVSTERAERPRFTWDQVWARRLDRHALATITAGATAADVVARMCGAHAQIMSAAELSIGIRLAGVTRADVRRTLWRDRELVKTFGPRGTVHLLPARDLPMWTGALSVVPQGPDGLPVERRLTESQTDEIVEAIGAALEGGELTIDELGERVVSATGPWAGQLVIPAFNGMWPIWRRALIPAAHRGVLCFGPDRGRNVTYASPGRWLPGFAPMAPPDARRILVRRYLDAYGPATPAHLAQWLSAPRRWATELFEAMQDELVEVEVEGTTAWATADSTPMAPPPDPAHIRLLPYFDAYAVGCHPRERLFPGMAAARALSRGQAGNVPVLLVDGIVQGVWHLRRQGRRLHITVESFDALSAQQRRAVDDQVARIGHIVEGDPVLTIGAVGAGKHL